MAAADNPDAAGTAATPGPLAAAELFAGTAEFYRRYRPRYPDAFFADLAARFDLSRRGRVLDLGCGPGFIAVPLAALGAEVIAVDPQPEMLAAAREEAAAAGCRLTCIEGTAEELDAGIAPLRITTLGRSFHWMQREAVLDFLDGVIEPEGAVVLLEEERPEGIDWRQVTRDYVTAWNGGASPAQSRNTRRRSGVPHRAVLTASPFGRLETLRYPVTRRWPIDSIVGYVYSTSAGTPARLSGNGDAFEAGLRDHLAALPGAPDFAEAVEVVATLAGRP
jgi:SAM-dependent methyltransferase